MMTMERKSTSYVRSTCPPERIKKVRTTGKTPRKGMGCKPEMVRLMPIIVSVSLLLVITSPLYPLFDGDDMIPGVEGSPFTTVTGTDDNDHFGWNVSGAGDVNGDGFDDIIVGAPGCNSNAGSAYLFFGGPWFTGALLAGNANVTLMGDTPGDRFGWDVSGAGDVNSDGLDDVLVGAPGADKAYIYYGQSTWFDDGHYDAIVEIRDDILDTTIEPDVDDLKYDDAQVYTVDQNETMFLDGFNATLASGSVKNATMYTKYAVEDGYSGTAYIQWALECQPLVNSDIQPQHGETNAVHTYNLFNHGVDSFDEIKTLNISFNNNDNHPKNASNDGYSDSQVSFFDEIRLSDNIYATTTDGLGGHDYIDVNFPDLHVPPTATINNVCVITEYYATAWTTEPGDGADERDDFEVWNGSGYQHWEDWGQNVGQPDEYWTSSDISPIINTPDKANTIQVRFRWDTSNFGDTLYIDTVTVEVDYTDAGGNDDVDSVDFDYVWVNVTLCHPRTILEGMPGDGFGLSVSGVGDVNNDGCDDVLIGAPKNSCDIGAAFVFFGDSGLNGSKVRINKEDAEITLIGDNPGDRFGSSVSDAGDVESDGFEDIIVGAPGANKAFVFLNHNQNNPVEIMLMDDFEDGILADWYEEEDENGAANVGNSGGAINGTLQLTDTDDTDVVSPVIDARGYSNLTLTYKRRMRDGDWSGNEDMLVMISVDGSSWKDITSEEAHGDTQTPDFIENRLVDLSSYKADNSIIELKFDLNDDGFMGTPQEWDFDDVKITGIPYFAKVTLEGSDPGDQFGFSVSNAGDVDGNGFDDIITGAPQNSARRGAAYIFDGVHITVENLVDGLINLSAGDTANITFVGESSNDLFGYSVASAGYFGSDGYGDVIVGAPDAGGNGTAYIFYGGSSLPLTIPALNAVHVETGESTNDYFGWSVSNAGDVVLGDGIDDIIIGAPLYDPLVNIDSGRAYIIKAASRPVIRDIVTIPGQQEPGGNVSINCYVTAFDGVYAVWVNITLPEGGYMNSSMTPGPGDQWFYDQPYLTIGIYQYTIWANDTKGNWSSSVISNFLIDYFKPKLTGPDIAPILGYIDTGFNFTVTYSHQANRGPDILVLNLTGPAGGIFPLVEFDPMDSDYTDGKLYYLNISGLNTGYYSFHFAANDTIGFWTESSVLGFDVINRFPSLSAQQISPSMGYTDTWFNFTVTYTNLDNQAPDVITVNITGLGVFSMTESDSLDNDCRDGKGYFYNATGFAIGSYNFNFAANDSLGYWTETGILQFDVVNRGPVLSSGQVTPITGYIDTQFNFTVTYIDLDGHAPDTITVNITALGIYQLNEVDTLDMDYTDGKLYFVEITTIPIGTAYTFHFAANDTLGLWAAEAPEIDAPDVVQRSATLTAIDETAKYSDTVYLNATLTENGTPIAGEIIGFYIDLNGNGIYEPGELVDNGTTLADGSVSVIYSGFIVLGTYSFTAVCIGPGGFDVNDSFAFLTITPKPTSLTAVSRIAEEDEVISMNATLADIDGNPVSGENVEIYLDKNKNGIYEGGELIGSGITSASGIASFTYTVSLASGGYGVWPRYIGSGNYLVTEIEGILVVQNTTNTPPEILGIVPDQTKPEDSPPWTLDLTIYEADIEDSGVDLRWYITGIDSTLYTVTGHNSTDDVFTFIPTENAFGNDEVTLWLVDGSGDSASQIMWVNITPVNDLPYFNPLPPNVFIHYDDPSSSEDDPEPWNYTFYVHDIETPLDSLVIVTSEPAVDSGEGYAEVDGLEVTYHYPHSRLGENILVTLTLYDGTDSAQTAILVNVTSEWVPELVINLPDITIEESTSTYSVFDLDDYFTDRDQDSLFFSSGYFHLSVVINENNTVDITPDEQWTGSEFVTFRAMDPTGAIVEDTITVTVVPVNDGPVISGAPNLVVHYDYSYGFDFSPYIRDPDNELSELTLYTSELTDNIWIQQHNNLGVIVNYPESMNGMTIPVIIYVSDGIETAFQEIEITVSGDFPPELLYKIPDVSFDEDTVLEDYLLLSYYFLDPDGDAMYFTNGTVFIKAIIDDNLTVDFSAPPNWYGHEYITFRATDPTGALAEDKILVVVVPVNDAPTIANIPKQEKNEGDQWVLDLTQYIDDVDDDLSELEITMESEVGQGYVVLVGNILVFQYPKGIQSDIVTITVSDGDLETTRSFTVTLQGSAQVAPSIWDVIPWLWIFLISIGAISGAFAFYAKKRKYNVYEAFLIHEKGLPIAHASYEEASELEDVVVSGMFTAVQDFISDAFSGKTQDDDWRLDEMKFGDNKILIERSENLYLAAIFEGNGERLGSRMRKLLKDIDEKYSGVLRDWDGDMTKLVGVSTVIAALVSKKAQKHTGSEESQTEIPRKADSEEPEDENLEEAGKEGEEQENPQKESEAIGSEKAVVYECPECESEIRSTDISCPVCGAEFPEFNDIRTSLTEEDEGTDTENPKKEKDEGE